jgi:hypothetical protein
MNLLLQPSHKHIHFCLISLCKMFQESSILSTGAIKSSLELFCTMQDSTRGWVKSAFPIFKWFTHWPLHPQGIPASEGMPAFPWRRLLSLRYKKARQSWGRERLPPSSFLILFPLSLVSKWQLPGLRQLQVQCQNSLQRFTAPHTKTKSTPVTSLMVSRTSHWQVPR